MKLIIFFLASFPLAVFAQAVKPYKASQEVLERYPVDSPLLIKNAWLPNGEQIIKDGDGYRIYDIGEIRRYQYKNGEANGEVLFLDSTQTIVFTKGYCKNGEPDSSWSNYYKSNKIKATYYYKNGKLNGEYKTFYENGQMKSRSFYINGCPSGQAIYYFENGKVEKKLRFKNCKVQK